MSKKKLKIALITPWGVSLFENELLNWNDVAIHDFMELHTITVVTLQENNQKPFRFKITRLD